jgi:flavin-dependent dehydrogenase
MYVAAMALVGLGWAAAGARAGAAPGAPEVRHLHRGPPPEGTVIQGARDVPVVHRADVVVVGGGVAGVAAALHAADAGCTVAILDERNAFGYEFGGSMRPVAGPHRAAAAFKTAEAILGRLVARKVLRDGRIDPSGLKVELARLIAARPRIKVYLYSMPDGVVVAGRRVQGVGMVNRSGRQIVLGRAVVDATADGRIAAAAGARFTRGLTGEKTARRFLVSTNAAYEGPTQIKLPADLGLLNDRVRVHRGARAGTTILEIAVPARIGENIALELARVQALTRRRAMQVVAHLREHVKGFEKLDEMRGYRVNLYLGDEPFLDEPPVVATVRPLDAAAVAALRLDSASALTPRDVEGLVVAGRIASAAPRMGDVQPLLCCGEAAGRVALAMAGAAGSFAAADGSVEVREARPVGRRVREFLKGPDSGRVYSTVRQAACALPVIDEVDVLVVGGGTAGAPAAIAAAQEGARVAVVEVLPLLGGIGTTTINRYYAGASGRSRLRTAIDKVSRPAGSRGAWSIERRKLVLQEMLAARGGRIYYRCLGAGAVVEDNRVVGAVVDSAAGRGVIRARIVIDATGHGDVAAAAGARFTKGRETDGFLHALALTGDLSNADTGLRDPTNVDDATDVTLKAHARYRTSPVYLSPQLAPRESRHVVGDYVLTLRDLLRRRPFPDVVLRCAAHYDRHGADFEHDTAVAQDWVTILGNWGRRVGGFVPYRALLAAGVENLLVVGMAYSGDHDSQIVLRMQGDYIHMGEAAGVAAALAAGTGATARGLSVGDLQKRLLARGVLRESDLNAVPRRFDPTHGAGLLGTPRAREGMIELYLAADASVPVLRPLLKSRDPAVRAEAGITLGMLADPSAADALLECLQHRSDRRFGGRGSRPFHWAAVILLGRLREKRAVPLMVDLLGELARRFGPDVAIDGASLRDVQLHMHLATYLIQALGRIADPSAAEAIRPFLQLRRVRGKVPPETMPALKWGPAVAAARALARMGDLAGVPTLIELLADDQALLRDHAQRVLEEITGQRFGKDSARWRDWWAKHKPARRGRS